MDDYKTIYEQRYATYRHLDKLRWFVFQIAISVIVGILVFKTSEHGSSILPIGILLLLSGVLMTKINNGIDKNNTVLHDVGIEIGDRSIPVRKEYDKYKSASFLISYGLIAIGVFMLFYKLLPLLSFIN